MRVRFNQWDCVVKFSTYEYNGSPAIVLISEVSHEVIAKATVLVEDFKLPGHVLIKDYSENKGMLAALIEGGIVRDTGQRVETGFVELAVCELLILPYRDVEP